MAGPLTQKAPVNTSRWDRVGRPIRPLVCFAIVAVVTAAFLVVPPRDRPLTAVLCFLFIVVIVSAVWGLRYSVFTSLVAAFGFSLLVPPSGHFQIRDLRGVYALIAFLVIGITTSRFSDRARREALNSNRREAEAVASQERFADLVNSVEGIVWEADAQSFVFSFVSEQAGRVLGYPAERWLTEATFWKDHLHPEDRDWAVQFCVNATAEKRNHYFEYRMIAADGRVVWLSDLVTVVVENGRPSRLRGVMTDITERKRVEQAREELEEQWRAAFDSNPTMYFIIDTDSKIVSVNTFGAEQLGYSESELVGQSVLNIFCEADRDAVQKRAKECFEQPGRMMRWEARKIRKDGSLMWVRETGNSVVLQKRPVLLVVCENITEQKRAEEAVRRSEKELRDVIETIPAMAWTTLPDGNSDFTNQSWLEYTGTSLENARGEDWRKPFHPTDIAGLAEKWRTSLATGKPYEGEARVWRASNGEYRWFLHRAVPLRDENGNILKWYGISTDIDDRKRAEALLTGEKRILEMVAKGDSLSQILDSLCRMVEEQASDQVLTSILLLEGTCLRHGGAPSLPKAYTDAIDGAEIGPSVGSCGTAAYRGEQVIVEDIANDPLWADYRAAALPHSLRACWSTPVFSSQGKVMATFAMYYREPRSPSRRDQEIIEQITHLAGVAIERKLTQQALRQSEGYLAEAQRLTKTGSWAWDARSDRMRYCSEEFYRIFGLDRQELAPSIEMVLQRVHPQERERARESVTGSRRKTEHTLEYKLLMPGGMIKYVLSKRHPVFDSTGELVEVIGTIVDVTERKRSEELLRESEGRFRSSVDHLTDALFIHDDQDEKGRVIDVNQQACDSLGYTREELIGMTAFDYDPSVDATVTLWIKERLARGETFSFESLHRRKDGTEFPVEIRVRPFWHGEHRFSLALARDITERKRAEAERDKLRQMEADLAHINRVSMMGELAASLAHEIKQPIAAAATNAKTSLRWLRREPPEVEEARETLSRIVNDVTRAAEIIDRNRSFYRRDTPQRQTVSLDELIREMIALLSDAADRHSVSIRAEVDDALPPITADRVQMQQVLMNLMLNGIEAMRDKGGELILSLKKAEDDRILLSVSDGGVGLPLENSERIFDAFFTTKAQGTGMGLSISRRIIEAHGGRLWATANSGQGATFHFTVPSEQAAMEKTAKRA
jgi:PAS domain S-box-containing protein